LGGVSFVHRRAGCLRTRATGAAAMSRLNLGLLCHWEESNKNQKIGRGSAYIRAEMSV